MLRSKSFIIVAAIFVLAIFSFVWAQEKLDLAQQTPTDPKIKIGQFDNGLKYYIRANQKPENRAEVRLVVNAGSVLEAEDQQGYAHLGEHMAFNGTQNFHKQELIDYLESIGMKFGPEVNAYTSFDEVVYMLQLPTDSLAQFETGMQILEDWAHLVSYEDEEITKERGVVIEEWRLGQGAGSRMRDKYFPILFKGSQYALRLPIGKVDILKNSDNAAVVRYFKEWYRPDLMAVIAIGDFDPAYVEGLIKKHFEKLEKPAAKLERTLYPVPDHDETLYAIVTDPEATQTSVSVYFKRPVQLVKTVGDYRRQLVENIYNQMLSNRLDELRQQADPPFIYGYSASGRLVRTKETYFLGSAVKEDGIERGLDALLTEAFRVKKFGFIESELERAKANLLRGYESAYMERDKTESRRYASEYINNYLVDEVIPGIEVEFEYAQALVPGVTLAEVNALVDKFITDHNRVVLVQGPEKAGVKIPTEDELKAVMAAAIAKELEPYDDKVSDEPLVKNVPQPGKITNERALAEIGVTVWTLSNGAKVVLKPTDFKNDEVQFRAFSWGGTSLAADKDYISARSAAAIMDMSGLGAFDMITLQKKLAGKMVGVSPSISELTEEWQGSASPKDLETLFQLLYLGFTAPRRDETAFASYKQRTKGYLENLGAMPERVFADTVTAVMNDYNPRRMPWQVADLEKIDLDACFKFYQERYANAGDFIFFFVGTFTAESIKPLVLTYIAGLPGLNRAEKWQDLGVEPPKGEFKKVVNKGLEPKARIQIIFSGPFEYNRDNNFAFNALGDVLDIKLREVIREDKSGTYGVSVSTSAAQIPKERYRVTITFGCAPERVEELTQTVFDVIDSVKTFGPADIYIQKVRETDLRSFETNIKENGYWLNELHSAYYRGWQPEWIVQEPALVETLSAAMIQKAAQKYFGTENVARFVLLPEKEEVGSMK